MAHDTNSPSPPLRGLYTLVQIARHGGFGAAAEQMNVTTSAVSHQIKSVEQWVGARLLERKTRTPKPTQIGARLIEAIAPSFSSIEDACKAARRGSEARKVVVSCSGDFATFVLMPRLSEFWETHPEIDVDVRLSAFDAPADPSAADISVRFLHNIEGGAALGPRGWSAVCSQDGFARLGKPLRLSDLRSGELYHEAVYNFWPECFALEDVSVPQDVVYRGIGDTGHILMAAMSGAGLALAPKALTQRMITDGLLISAFDVGIEPDATYVAFAHGPAARKPAADKLLTWLVAALSRVSGATDRSLRS